MLRPFYPGLSSSLLAFNPTNSDFYRSKPREVSRFNKSRSQQLVKRTNSADISRALIHTFIWPLWRRAGTSEQTNQSRKFFLRLLLRCAHVEIYLRARSLIVFPSFASHVSVVCVCPACQPYSLISSTKPDLDSLLTISNGHSSNGYVDEFMPWCLEPPIF